MAVSVLHSTKTITPEGIRDVFVVFDHNTIIDIASARPDVQEVIELGDQVLMPGIIDPHVHINEPGRTDWEGFNTGTRAAIAGGITTIVDMPLNSAPVTTTVSAFEQKLIAASQHLHTDCGFWAGVVPGNQAQLGQLAGKGALGFKAFLTHSGIADFPNVTEADLHIAMPIIAATGLPLLVHCELSDSNFPAITDPRSYEQYLHSRPALWEVNAIKLMIRLCRQYRCKVHIVHLSAAEAIPMIRKAKDEGLPLTVETAQHYLHFNAEEIPDGDTAFKCAPPIRNKQNQQHLWQALKEGLIDFVATDHSPAPPTMKKPGEGNFQSAWGGIASLQFALPALYTPAIEQDCAITQVAQWLTTGPANLLGKQHSIGSIKKGYKPNFIAWNPGERFTVTADRIHHRHTATPYLNRELSGVVHQTWLHGIKVYDNGNFQLNHGQLVYSHD